MEKRGRPRQFEESVVLQKAMELFWQQGYAATSLDQIVASTGVNRPSLYSVFGSKLDMYVACLNRFSETMEDLARSTMDDADTLDSALSLYFKELVDIYYGGADEDHRLGCLLFSNAITEAPRNEAVQATIRQALNGVQVELGRTVKRLSPNATQEAVDVATDSAVSTLLSLGVRVRSGLDRKGIEDTLENSIKATLSTLS